MIGFNAVINTEAKYILKYKTLFIEYFLRIFFFSLALNASIKTIKNHIFVYLRYIKVYRKSRKF